MELYYASGLRYETGDIIQPGNWGRVIAGNGPLDRNYYLEMFLEEVRRQVAPDKPSRLRAFYGLRHMADLARYQGQTNLPYGYKVVVASGSTVDFADLEAFDRLGYARGYADSRGFSEEYWAARGSYLEVLTDGPAEVVEVL